MNKKILELLYRSFDSDLEEEELRLLEEELEKSSELRAEKEQILARREAVSKTASLSFRPFFAERVMNRIQEISQKNGLEAYYETFKAIFRRFAIVGAVVMIALIVYNLGAGDSLSAEEIFYASDVTLDEILNLPLF